MTTKFCRTLFIALILSIPFGLLLREVKPTSAQSRETPLVTAILDDFGPERDGFNFTNSQLTKKILDTYSTPQGLRDATYINGLAMAFMFGEENVCLDGTGISNLRVGDNGSSNCILTSPARRWLEQQIKSMAHGVCEGMALSSLYFWLGRHNHTKNWDRPNPVVISMSGVLEDGAQGTSRASDVPITDRELHTYATILFAMQSIDRVYKNAQENRNNKTPSEMLQEIESSLQNARSNWEDKIFDAGVDPLYTIGVYQKDKNGRLFEGHTLLPYKVWDLGDNTKRVFVYDSNYVYGSSREGGKVTADDTYIEFQGDSWRYAPPTTEVVYSGDATSKKLDISLLNTRDTDPTKFNSYHDCTFCKGGTSNVEIGFFGPGDLTVENLRNANGENERVTDIPFKGGLGFDVPATYLLPADAPYEIDLKGTNDDAQQSEDLLEEDFLGTDLMISGSGYTLGLEGIDLRANSELFAYVEPHKNGPEFTFDADTATAVPGMFITIDDDTTGYEIDISGFTLSDEKGVVVRLDSEKKRLYFTDDDGADDTYTFEVYRISSSENEEEIIIVEETITVEVQLPADQVAYLAYAELGNGEWADDEVPIYFADADQLVQTDEDYLSIDTTATTTYRGGNCSGGVCY
ncbi:MAG: hypothetical protein AAF821_20995 [Cyanobacteria bacterium P01_D01_bin.156]